MKRFENILLVAYGSGDIRAALKRAARLAKENQAQLTLVDVVEKLHRETTTLPEGISHAELEAMATRRQHELSERLIAPLRRDGVDVSAKVLVGKPFIEIIREVLRNKHDLVIKSAPAKTKDKAGLFRSTDMQLMRACPCPVWLIKPRHRKKYARILAAVDPDPSDEEKSRLNELILDLATSLAAIEHSELHVVHTWVLYSERVLKLLIGDVSKMARDTRKMHRRWLQALLEKYDPKKLELHVHLLEGKAKDLVPVLARKKGVELVIMGTVARSGLPELLIGNTAENVLSRVDCSVLTVKPAGFVTPVGLGD